MFKKLFPVFLIGVLAVVGISAVLAQDVLVSSDGRLNAFDQGAPVAVYYADECSKAANGDGQRFHHSTGRFVDPSECARLDVLAIDPATGNGSLALQFYPSDIVALFASGDRSFTDNGVTLNVREDGQFWVETAPNFEGKVYSFAWFDEGRTFVPGSVGAPVVVTRAPVIATEVTTTVTSEATAEATAEATVEATEDSSSDS
jgi:hypothetical protein